MSSFLFYLIHSCVFSFTLYMCCHSLSITPLTWSIGFNYKYDKIIDCDVFFNVKMCWESFTGLSGCYLSLTDPVSLWTMPVLYIEFGNFSCHCMIPTKLWHLGLELLFIPGTVTLEGHPLLHVMYIQCQRILIMVHYMQKFVNMC